MDQLLAKVFSAAPIVEQVTNLEPRPVSRLRSTHRYRHWLQISQGRGNFISLQTLDHESYSNDRI